MSVNSLEAALYDIVMNRAVRDAFKADGPSVLSGYPLDEREQQIIVSLDAPALLAAGVNPMLLQGYWMVTYGPAAIGDLGRLLDEAAARG